MVTRTDLRKTAREYLKAAEILRDNQKYDVAVYLCGYAVEIALKDRICRTLKWPGFPATSSEFNNFRSFQTHNLAVLLDLSALSDKAKLALGTDWFIVTKWTPEQRYNPRGTKAAKDAADMINATKSVLRVIL